MSHSPAKDPRGVRVLTMNVLEKHVADWARRRQVLARGIQHWQPDIVALQEVVRDGSCDGVSDLFGEGWHVSAHPCWSTDGVGAVLASRWPSGLVRSDGFRNTGRIERAPWGGVTATEVRAPDPFGPLLVVHHKPSWPRGHERDREVQAVTAARLVESMAGDRFRHVVLMGDFDATPDSASVRFWTGLQSLDGMSVCYRDVWSATHPDEPGHTFSQDNPLVRRGDMPEEEGRRIDYVMVRCADHGPTLHADRCERLFSEAVNGVWASDHFGLVADLSLPRHPSGSQ